MSDDHADDARRESARIVAAAWAVLERSKYSTLKVRQVLVASGTSAQVFYRHFPSKAHLILHLLKIESEHVAALTRIAIEAAPTATDQLRAWLDFMLTIADEPTRAQRARLFLDPDLNNTLADEASSAIRRTVELLAQILRAGAEAGNFGTENPDRDALMIFNLVRGVTLDRLSGVDTTPHPDVLEQVYQFARRAIT